MSGERPLLEALRDALQALASAERERARAWAFAGSGLMSPPEGLGIQMEAERELEDAHERLRRAREALLMATLADDRAWGGH